MKRPEQQLQQAVAQYLDLTLPASSTWWHTPNEGRRSLVEGRALKSMGMRAGVPDILILHRGKLYALELKTGRNKLTASQERLRDNLTGSGLAGFAVVRSIEDVTEALKGFGLLSSQAGEVAPQRALESIPAVQSKSRGGRPSHQPDDSRRAIVVNLCLAGYTHDQIAKAVGCSDETLRKYYGHELRTAKAGLDAKIANTIARKALAGDNACLALYARSRLGWTERSHVSADAMQAGPVKIEFVRKTVSPSGEVHNL